tara:strand:+ start:164 stop:1504 length:1341 start_codon:yes stop_codon:yes gene_type:complete
MAEKFDKEDLLNWIETQPELSFIRDQAKRTFVSYDTNEEDVNKRINVIGRNELNIKKSFSQKLFDLIWVPGRELRGKCYSDESLDKKLSAASSLMSFSTIWDMVCTFPVLFYLAKGLQALTLPAAAGASLLILAMSNAAGKFAMDRNKGNKSLATFLLFIFFILSLVKTAFSGVGLELMGGSQRLKNLKAKEILSQKGLLKYERQDTKAFEQLYANANSECNRLADDISRINQGTTSGQREARKIRQLMYARPKNPTNNDATNLLTNYSTELGPCTKRDLISSLTGVTDQNQAESFSNLTKLEDALSPLALLYIRSRGTYYANFNGNALKGEPVKLNWFTIDPNLGITVDRDCANNDEKCIGPVRWASGNDAIRTSTIDFYEKVGRRDIKSIGASLIGFIISIILSATAVVLLFNTSNNIKVRASRSTDLNIKRNQIFTKLRTNKK